MLTGFRSKNGGMNARQPDSSLGVAESNKRPEKGKMKKWQEQSANLLRSPSLVDHNLTRDESKNLESNDLLTIVLKRKRDTEAQYGAADLARKKQKGSNGASHSLPVPTASGRSTTSHTNLISPSANSSWKPSPKYSTKNQKHKLNGLSSSLLELDSVGNNAIDSDDGSDDDHDDVRIREDARHFDISGAARDSTNTPGTPIEANARQKPRHPVSSKLKDKQRVTPRDEPPKENESSSKALSQTPSTSGQDTRIERILGPFADSFVMRDLSRTLGRAMMSDDWLLEMRKFLDDEPDVATEEGLVRYLRKEDSNLTTTSGNEWAKSLLRQRAVPVSDPSGVRSISQISKGGKECSGRRGADVASPGLATSPIVGQESTKVSNEAFSNFSEASSITSQLQDESEARTSVRLYPHHKTPLDSIACVVEGHVDDLAAQQSADKAAQEHGKMTIIEIEDEDDKPDDDLQKRAGPGFTLDFGDSDLDELSGVPNPAHLDITDPKSVLRPASGLKVTAELIPSDSMPQDGETTGKCRGASSHVAGHEHPGREKSLTQSNEEDELTRDPDQCGHTHALADKDQQFKSREAIKQPSIKDHAFKTFSRIHSAVSSLRTSPSNQPSISPSFSSVPKVDVKRTNGHEKKNIPSQLDDDTVPGADASPLSPSIAHDLELMGLQKGGKRDTRGDSVTPTNTPLLIGNTNQLEDPVPFQSSRSATSTEPLVAPAPNKQMSISSAPSKEKATNFLRPTHPTFRKSPLHQSFLNPTVQMGTKASRSLPIAEPMGISSSGVRQPLDDQLGDKPSQLNNLASLTGIRAVLGKHLGDLHNDHEYEVRYQMTRARASSKSISLTDPNMSHESKTKNRSLFAHMKAQQAEVKGKARVPKNHLYMSVEVYNESGKRSISKTQMVCPVVTMDIEDAPGTAQVPGYTHYVSTKRNVLCENTKQMHVWPYFHFEGENIPDEDKLYAKLKSQYDVDVEDWPRKVYRTQQSRTYTVYVENFLAEIGCSMSDILYYFLEPDNDAVKRASQGCLDRDALCQEDFSRGSSRWVQVLSKLPQPSKESLRKAALACTAFSQSLPLFTASHKGLTLWQIARKSEAARLPEDSQVQGSASYGSIACRICHLHDCPYHGEYRATENSSDGEEDASDEREGAKDADYPPNINHKKRVILPAPVSGIVKSPSHKSRNRGLDWWFENSITWDHSKRPPFYPCFHPGLACNQAQCRCYRDKVQCEKTCGCALECDRRFRGCSCKKNGAKKRCLQDQRCECFRLNRECDPDLCRSCGVDVVLNPENRYSEDEEILGGCCRNAGIQAGRPKRTILGTSKIHGFGLFAGETIRKDEYIGEYQGEIITRAETDRRAQIYEAQELSYLFALNREQEIDSQRYGNKIRFINHASDSRCRNIYPKIVLCNGAHRIGMYAQRDIAITEELFFDYGKDYYAHIISNKGPDEPQDEVVSKTRNRALVNTFPEPDESDDDGGDGKDSDRNTMKSRRTAATKSGATSRPKSKPSKTKSVSAVASPTQSARVSTLLHKPATKVLFPQAMPPTAKKHQKASGPGDKKRLVKLSDIKLESSRSATSSPGLQAKNAKAAAVVLENTDRSWTVDVAPGGRSVRSDHGAGRENGTSHRATAVTVDATEQSDDGGESDTIRIRTFVKNRVENESHYYDEEDNEVADSNGEDYDEMEVDEEASYVEDAAAESSSEGEDEMPRRSGRARRTSQKARAASASTLPAVPVVAQPVAHTRSARGRPSSSHRGARGGTGRISGVGVAGLPSSDKSSRPTSASNAVTGSTGRRGGMDMGAAGFANVLRGSPKR